MLSFFVSEVNYFIAIILPINNKVAVAIPLSILSPLVIEEPFFLFVISSMDTIRITFLPKS